MKNRSEQVEALFQEAAALESRAQRSEYLDRACPEPELRREVESLLEALENPDSLLARGGDESATLPASTPVLEQPGALIGRYKLLQRIGEGGMGVVYMAEQTEPVTRKVALKIIKLGMDTRQVVARFEAERQALAMMDHPNIARVLDAGATDTGRPYFVMELVRGVPITEYCDKNKLSTQERLQLFLPVCRAIQHAHQKGVIHRDIKPSNVMVTLHDGDAVPKVIDFGIAKATNQKLTEKTLFTHYAQMIGTPAYMSPEQAEMSGMDVDTRTDVYSLGVLLYELLTGTTPFPSKELLSLGYGEMQRIIAEKEPPKPSTRLSTMHREERTVVAQNRSTELSALGKGLQGDLDWIVMKCLEKHRSRRYDTANGLAADVGRYLNNEPVTARPPSVAYRMRKTWRRNRVLCTAGALVAVALVAGLALSMIGLRRAVSAEAREAEQRQVATRKALEAEEAKQAAEAARGEAVEKAQALKENLYSQSVALAYREMTANRPAHALQLLESCPEELRDWEWNHVRHRSMVGRQPVIQLHEPIYALTFSPNGRDVAVIAGGTLRLAELTPAGALRRVETLGPVPPAFSEMAPWITFSPDSRWLAAAGTGGRVTIWDVDERTPVQSFIGSTNPVDLIAFHPSGKELAVVSSILWGSSEATIDMREVPSGRLIRRIQSGANVFSIAYSPEGRWLAAGLADGHRHLVRVYDASSGERVAELFSGRFPIMAVAFSPEGRWLASGGDPAIKFWDVSDWKLATVLPGHSMPVVSLAFTPRGTRLVSAGLDREIKIWDPFKPRELLSLHGHTNGISGIAVTSGGRLVSGDSSGDVRVWDAASPPGARERLTLTGHTERIYTVAFHPDNSGRLYSVGDDGGCVWDGVTGRVVDRFPATFDLTISRDGRHIVHPGAHEPDDGSGEERSSAGGAREVEDAVPARHRAADSLEGGIAVEINDAYSVTNYHSSPNPEGNRFLMFFCADISVDGEWLAGGTANGEVHVWKRRTGVPRLRLLGHHAYLVRVRFSPDGRYLVSLGEDGEILRWDATRLEQPQEAFPLLPPTAMREVAHIGFSEDGQRLVTGDGFSGIVVLDVETGRQLLSIPQAHGGIVVSARFSPDGRWLASGGSDNVVRLWDAATGEPKGTLIGHTSVVNDVVFSPDGRRLASTGWDQTIRLWAVELDVP